MRALEMSRSGFVTPAVSASLLKHQLDMPLLRDCPNILLQLHEAEFLETLAQGSIDGHTVGNAAKAHFFRIGKTTRVAVTWREFHGDLSALSVAKVCLTTLLT